MSSPALAFLRRSVALALLAAGLAAAGLATAADSTLPYDEKADAHVELNLKLQEAAAQHKQVLVVFGANWCKDCRVLAQQMASGPVADLVRSRYVVAKVDVGRFDKQLDIAQRMGDPIKQGIPAVAVLDAQGQVLGATRAGELADARHMGTDAVLKVFEKLGKPS